MISTVPLLGKRLDTGLGKVYTEFSDCDFAATEHCWQIVTAVGCFCRPVYLGKVCNCPGDPDPQGPVQTHNSVTNEHR